MRKHLLLFTTLLFLFSTVWGQNPTSILTNVDTIWPGGAPGQLNPLQPNVIPLVSGRPCGSSLIHYSVATEYQNGKVVAVAHEGIFTDSNIPFKDNLTFLTNAIEWITSGNSKRVSFRPGFFNQGNTQTLQANLSPNGYTFNSVNGTITSASLANTDILILGNDWNSQTNYSAAELAAIESFVGNGGGLFIAGLGWSFPGPLNQYPMNSVANQFGFEFTTAVISDPFQQFNSYPLLYNLYPDNLDTNQYCASPYYGSNPQRGDTLRVLRLAVSTTGEFTQQKGGVAGATALIGPWLEIINETYGRESCVRFELIPNNQSLIFPDPATDPWATLPNGSGGCTNAGVILDDQADVIDSIIGAANYDISHVIAGSPFGGGCAGSFKAGLSGGFDIAVTRHEMGHQFGQSHTINNNGPNNYEPETGAWTAQGGNGQGNFHAVSFHQLALTLTGIHANTGSKLPTGNTIPSLVTGPDVFIPVSTPFTISASANDNDFGDLLTYVWDNMSPGIPQTIPVGDDSQGALFWRLLPGTDSSRTFPRMSDVIANNNSTSQEQLPTQARIMDIRVTVNDNHRMVYQGDTINASGITSQDIRLTVAEAGPFEVTSQGATGIVYPGLSMQQVTWDVNGTDTMPINTQEVEISLSVDGGFTYPYTLQSNAPNTGSAMVNLPNLNTTTARFKVAAVGNIYFDLNTTNFEIQEVIVGSDDPGFSSVYVSPNPTNDQIHIQGLDGYRTTLQLFDLRGVLQRTVLQSKQMDVSDLPQGVYLLQIEIHGSGKKTRRKVLVKN